MSKHRGTLVGSIVFVLAALPLAAQTRQTTGADVKNEPRNAFKLAYEYEDFRSSDAESWYLASADLSHRFGFGRVIARVNRARRFESDGTQFEVDAYPHLAKGLYMYLNAGWSKDSIFPDHRYGGEIYKNLPHAWEASIGFRQLNFTNSNITLYTGTIAKYKGNFYYVLRPYLSRDDEGTSWSGQVTIRRYYEDANHYYGFSASYGKSPTEDITLGEINRLRTWTVRATMDGYITKNLLYSTHIGYRDQEFRLETRRRSMYAGLGLQVRF